MKKLLLAGLVSLTVAAGAPTASVDLTWECDTPGSKFVVLYGTSPAIYTNSFEVGTTNCSVHQLKKNTLYYFVVRATDNGMYGVPSNEVHVTTPKK